MKNYLLLLTFIIGLMCLETQADPFSSLDEFSEDRHAQKTMLELAQAISKNPNFSPFLKDVVTDTGEFVRLTPIFLKPCEEIVESSLPYETSAPVVKVDVSVPVVEETVSEPVVKAAVPLVEGDDVVNLPQQDFDPNRPINILSINGGGIRGIIAALILEEIEKRARCPIADLFDFIGGTSTGGILALGLTQPKEGNQKISQYSTSDMVKFYKTLGEEIFPQYKNLIHKYLCKIPSTFFWGSEYSPLPLESKLKELMKKTPLSAVRTPVVITAVDVEENKLRLFRSVHAQKDPKENFYTADIARATAAAPTYFPQAQISPINKPDNVEHLIDGGVTANNPALLTFLEARNLFGSKRPINLISIGTGKIPQINDTKEVPFILKAKPILQTMLQSQSNGIDSVLKDMAKAQPDLIRYKHFDVSLDGALHGLDKPQNIRKLEKVAKEAIENRNEEINNIVNLLQTAKRA